MKFSIVYESQTGNTRQLAEAIRSALPPEDCLYLGPPEGASTDGADVIFVGFWTDKGDCPQALVRFLEGQSGRRVALFGTAGFGGSQSYFDEILSRVHTHLPPDAQYMGGFLCQGRMPQSVKARYEKGLEMAPGDKQLTAMLENYRLALPHPSFSDLAAAAKFALDLASDMVL